jgi:hypothetical protein
MVATLSRIAALTVGIAPARRPPALPDGKIIRQGRFCDLLGNGLGYSGDGGPATDAQLGLVNGLAVDNVGSVFISDARIRKVATDGTITTVATLSDRVGGMAVDAAGNLYLLALNIGDNATVIGLEIEELTADGGATTVAAALPGGADNAEIYGLAVEANGCFAP